MQIDELLKQAKTVAIFGHVRPDGDCVGSTLALYNYICDNYPSIKVQIFLERFPESYKILARSNETSEIYENDSEPYDLAFLVDAPSFERIGANGTNCLKTASVTCNIDHHISNTLSLCTHNFVDANASSACEVLYFLMDPDKINKDTAECLYLGIVHDTGAFKFRPKDHDSDWQLARKRNRLHAHHQRDLLYKNIYPDARYRIRDAEQQACPQRQSGL